MRLLTFLVFILLALPTSAATLEKGDLVIKTAGGQSYHFNVEIAKTPEQQERG